MPVREPPLPWLGGLAGGGPAEMVPAFAGAVSVLFLGQYDAAYRRHGTVSAIAGAVSVQFPSQLASLEQDGSYAASQLAGGSVLPIGSTVYGAADRRHGMWCRAIARHDSRGGMARPCRGLAKDARGRPLEPARRSAGRSPVRRNSAGYHAGRGGRAGGNAGAGKRNGSGGLAMVMLQRWCNFSGGVAAALAS